MPSGNERVVLADGPKDTRTHYSTSLQITPTLLSFNPSGEIECRILASQAELKKAGVRFRLGMEFAPSEGGPWGERGPDGRPQSTGLSDGPGFQDGVWFSSRVRVYMGDRLGQWVRGVMYCDRGPVTCSVVIDPGPFE